jgi:signal transduction histidine kinase/ActR/RegA family two-component response regulator
LRLLLFAAAVLFTAAAAFSLYRLNLERNALFHTFRTGTWIVAEVQVEYLKTVRLAEAFRADPSQKNLGKLQTAFDIFWSRVALIKTSSEASGVRDIDAVMQAFAEIDKNLPLLDADLKHVTALDSKAITAFLQHADGLNLTIARMTQQVFIQDPLLYERTQLVGKFDLTNIVLGIALVTGLMLILLGLVQLQRSEQLYDQNARTRALLETRIGAIEATRDGIALVAPDGTVEFANQSLVGLLGILSADIIVGRTWDDVPAIGKVQLSSGQAGKAISTEIAIAWGKKDTRYWDLSITPRDDHGSVVLVRDVTDRRSAQRQNELLREQFLRSQKMEAVGRLAGGIAHDFNNILAAVSGFAHLLKDDLAAQPEQAGFASQILSAAERGKELVKRILSFSRADMERQSTIDLRKVVEETIQMLSSALPKRGRFHSVIPEVLPPIFGNATQIAQVIMNLVVNASDATDETKGEITLEIDTIAIDGGCAQGLLAELSQHAPENPIRVIQIDTATSKAWIGILTPPGQYVHIRVADTGTGIPFGTMERMFDPFFTTKDQGKGTGLGLASVIGIVKSHHGAIAVESTLGVGSVFHIFLPIADVTNIAAAEPDTTKPSLVLSGTRVLIVDDDIAVGTVLQKMFDRFDCDATLCGDSLMARESVIEDPSAFDLIVTDMTMPDLNGIDLAAACRRAGFAGTLLLVTGRAETVSEPLLRSAGINGLLSKPFSQDDVVRQVRHALGHDGSMIS